MTLVGFETPHGPVYINPDHVVSVQPRRGVPKHGEIHLVTGLKVLVTGVESVDDLALLLVDPAEYNRKRSENG